MSNYKGNVSYLDELEVNEYKVCDFYPFIYKTNELGKGIDKMNNYKGNVSYVDKLEVNKMYPNIYEKVGE